MIESDAEPARIERIAGNIAVGQRFILVDPAILEGYLYAAAFELRLEPQRKY